MPDLDAVLQGAHATVVRPGDHLLIAINRPQTREQCEEAACQLGQLLPGVNVTVIDSVAAALVYRPS